MSTDPVPPAAAPRTSVAQRYARQVAAISVVLLLSAGLTEGYFAYRQAREQMADLQAVQVNAAAAEIDQYLRTVTQALQHVQSLPWGEPGFGAQERREELHRLLALNPAIVDIQDVFDDGSEAAFVSRTALDRTRRVNSPSRTEAGGYGPPFFDEEGVPNVVYSAPARWSGRGPGQTRMTINLRFLADVVSGLRSEDGRQVYVVDRSDRLIAHPDPTLALRQKSVATHPAVAEARRALAAGEARLRPSDGPGLLGGSTVTSAVALGTQGWLLFVEQPRANALRPALATLDRMTLLLIVGGGTALMVSRLSANRMAAPIARLREATARLAAGFLETRLEIRTGDEIELLALDFNAMSERLQRSYEELEAKVAARTRELAQRRDEAERANAAKTRFLASASHDLRQPMHAIGLLVGVLRLRLKESELLQLADKTHQAVQAMENLFGALLDVSKLDAGAVRPQAESLELHSLLERLESAYGPLAAVKGLDFRTRAARATVLADAAILERILGNLCSNAIRYTHRGGVLLACRRRGDAMVLQVFDTGVGIPAEHLDAIFEEFVRLDPPGGHPADKGLGLGLSIVRRSALLLGTEVRVVSRLNRGSRFELVLPTVPTPTTAAENASRPTAADGRLEGTFVLLVDNEDAVLHATAALLKQWGCLVATARSHDAAIEEAARHLRPPDVIVTDLRLDRDNGLNLVRRLRREAGVPLPAVVITAETGHWPHEDVRVLHKPASSRLLWRALCDALTEGRPAPQSGMGEDPEATRTGVPCDPPQPQPASGS